MLMDGGKCRDLAALRHMAWEKAALEWMGLEAGVGIEPAYTELQSAASPLCHPALKGPQVYPISTVFHTH